MNSSRSIVALIPCESYQRRDVFRAVEEGFSLLGARDLFRSGERILIKPNLLRKADPKQAITTHPAVFEAVLRTLKDSGCNDLTYGDSPGTAAPKAAVEACGLAKPAGRYGAVLADFVHGETVRRKGYSGFSVCRGALNADAIVNVCKMKTHQMMRVTGAIKNMLGCLCGVNKAAQHAKFPDADAFAEMLVELNLMLAPRLHIMDGILAMEGNGPASGNPVPMKVLMMSTDPVALDSVFCALIHLNPALLPTNLFGEQKGLGQWRFENIAVRTPAGEISPEEAAKRYGKSDFDVYRGASLRTGKKNRLLTQFFSSRPVILQQRCVRCGICVRSCPLAHKAIHLDKKSGKIPQYDYQRCIRCFCCQEMCPEKAIISRTPMLRKLLDLTGR